MLTFDESEVELIDEVGEEYLGCGYIPKHMLVEALGGLTLAHNCYAVQVRFYSPGAFGIGKGMLCVKDGIDKSKLFCYGWRISGILTHGSSHLLVQIPRESMVKVEVSEWPWCRYFILNIILSIPSSKGKIVGRAIAGEQLSKTNKRKLNSPAEDAWKLLERCKGVRKVSLDQCE